VNAGRGIAEAVQRQGTRDGHAKCEREREGGRRCVSTPREAPATHSPGPGHTWRSPGERTAISRLHLGYISAVSRL